MTENTTYSQNERAALAGNAERPTAPPGAFPVKVGAHLWLYLLDRQWLIGMNGHPQDLIRVGSVCKHVAQVILETSLDPPPEKPNPEGAREGVQAARRRGQEMMADEVRRQYLAGLRDETLPTVEMLDECIPF